MGRRLLSFALLLLISRSAAFGGALLPLITGAISDNGEFIVIVGYDLDKSEPGVTRIKRVTYRVQRREHFINHRFRSSNIYWSESVGWKVIIPWQQQMGVPLPVVSDDGNVVALLAIEAPQRKDMEAIWIYKMKDSSGELIGSYRLQDIWNREELRKGVVSMVIDGRPLWLDGSRFEFSSNSQQFIFHTVSGRTVRFDVRSGNISGD